MTHKILRALLREGRVNLNYALRPKSSPHTAPGERRRVAIVRPERIGDFVLATPALGDLRKGYGDAHVTFVGHEDWRDLAVWVNEHRLTGHEEGLFDDFIGIRPEGLPNRTVFRRYLDLLSSFDTLVYCTCSRTNPMDKLLAATPGETIGCAGNDANIARRQNRRNQRLYDRLLPNPEGTREYERNAAFAAALHPAAPSTARPPLWRVPEALAQAELAALCARHALDPAAPFIVLSPFSSVRLKEWPLTKFRELARRIHDTWPELPIVVLGSPRDRARAAKWLADEPLLDLTGEVSLVQAACIIAQSVLSISGDTMAAHIASAVGTDNVILLGGGQYGRFFPYDSPAEGSQNIALTHEMPCFHCNWFCKYRLFSDSPAPCVERVQVNRVFNNVQELLNRRGIR